MLYEYFCINFYLKKYCVKISFISVTNILGTQEVQTTCLTLIQAPLALQ
jgi:hypothetical protein